MPPFQGTFQGLQIHLVLLICCDGFLPFPVLVEQEVKLRRARFHLLMADAAGVGQQRETVGRDDLVCHLRQREPDGLIMSPQLDLAAAIFGRVENAEAVANFAFAQRERFILKGRRTYPEVVDSSDMSALPEDRRRTLTRSESPHQPLLR